MAGVFGAFSYDDNQNIVDITDIGLRFLQTRGQESGGMSVGSNKYLKTYKGKGKVDDIFNQKILKIIDSPSIYSSIGQVRSFKIKDADKIEPVELEEDNFKISVVMDGKLFEQDKFSKYNVDSEESTELFGKIFLKYMTETKKTNKAAKKTMIDLNNGYYSAVILVNDGKKTKEIGIRDKTGLKPFCIGKTGNTYILSSESFAFTGSINGELVRDVRPGEIIEFNPKNLEFKSEQIIEPKPRHCAFEYNYYANRASVIEGISVDYVRREIGRKLFELHKGSINKNGKVVPVPDSGRGVSLGFAKASGMFYDEDIIKNPYAKRTFIIPDEESRLFETSIKYTVVKDAVKGQILYVGDDSQVRGTESRYITFLLKVIGGAKEVHFFFGTPPCIATCQDFLKEGPKSFIASKYRGKDIQEIGRCVAKEIGADSMMYPTMDMEIETIGIPREKLCLACLDGSYPVKITS